MSRPGYPIGPRAAAVAAGALLLGAVPAAAQLSAETLWADWQSAYTGFGGALSAEAETYEGGVLLLRGVAVESRVEGAESSTRLGDVTLRELPDGTVAVELPNVMALTSTTTIEGPDGPETVEMQIELTQNDFDMIVSEEGDARRYVYEATSMIASFETPEGMEGGEGLISVATRGLEGVTTVAGERFEQSQAAESLTFQTYAPGPEGEGGTTVRYQMTGMTGEASGAMPPAGGGTGGAPMSLSAMRLDATGALRHSGSLIEIDNDGAQAFTAQGGSESGAVEFALSPDSLTYALLSEGTEMEVVTAAFPQPIPFALASSRTEIQLPLGGGEGPAPFGMVLAFRDLSLGEAVWGLFDPTGQLPREPVTVVLDLDGTATMNVDLFGDPAALAELQGPPGTPETLEIAELLVRFGGAELRGEGAVRFDEAMTPVGAVDLALDGGMALMDRLAALGVLPQDQVLGLRAMLGVVARPVGEDSLVSTIEFTEEGGIVANGMQVQ